MPNSLRIIQETMIHDVREKRPASASDSRCRHQWRSSYRHSFNLNAGKAGIQAAFTPHSLRHAFVSALLSHGVPITDVAAWLGHRNINVTYAIYGHLVPSSLGRAQEALNAEYAEWRQAA